MNWIKTERKDCYPSRYQDLLNLNIEGPAEELDIAKGFLLSRGIEPTKITSYIDDDKICFFFDDTYEGEDISEEIIQDLLEVLTKSTVTCISEWETSTTDFTTWKAGEETV